MKRIFPLALLALAACAPQVPNSAAGVGAGVGFDAYENYETEALGQGEEQEPIFTFPAPADSASVPTLDNPDISDEQDFEAVSGRQDHRERCRASRTAAAGLPGHPAAPGARAEVATVAPKHRRLRAPRRRIRGPAGLPEARPGTEAARDSITLSAGGPRAVRGRCLGSGAWPERPARAGTSGTARVRPG